MHFPMEPRNRETVKMIGLLVSFLYSVLAGITLSFNVYALPLKSTFNFTQSEVELVASANTADAVGTVIGPLLLATVGYKIIYTLSFIFIVSGTVSFGLSATASDFFGGWPSLVCLFQFIMSSGNDMVFFTFVAVGGVNFGKSTGKVTGVYTAATTFGKAFFALVYQCFFQRTQDLGSFFFTVAIMNIVVLPLCFVFHKPRLSVDEEELIQLTVPASESDMGIRPDNSSNVSASSITSIRQMFRSLYFNLLFWPCVFFHACEFTIMNNITTLAKTLDEYEPLYLVYVLTTILIFARIFSGILYDRFQSKTFGFGLLFVCYVTLIIVLIIAIKIDNRTTVLYIVTILCGVGVGMGFLIPSLMLTLEFGVQYLGIITGLFFATVSALTIMLQIVVGILYDEAKFQQNSPDMFCHGHICFVWIWGLILSITILITLCEVVNFCYSIYYKERC